eukprot:gene27275-32946_t
MSEHPSSDESLFAKALTDPDASTRKKTFSTLERFLERDKAVASYKSKNFLRLWKILYYTLWLTDKIHIQQEMVESLVGLLDKLKLPQQVMFFEAFFHILLKEWNFLDQYRMNKFYVLIRAMIYKLFSLMAKGKWQLSIVSSLYGALDHVLSSTPNGPRFHIIDIFVEELRKASDGEASTEVFLELLRPFLDLMRGNTDKVVKQRIRESLVLKLVELQYPDDNAQDAEKPVFPNLSCVAIQKRVFELAADESTPDASRGALYKLHKAISLRTGVFHYDENDEADTAEEAAFASHEDVPEAKAEQPLKAGSKAKGSKKRKGETNEAVTEVREDAAQDRDQKKKKKKST